MLMMLAVLGFSGKGRPADAHDAGRLGALWQRTPQLMLMMLAGLWFSGKDAPADAHDAGRLLVLWQGRPS